MAEENKFLILMHLMSRLINYLYSDFTPGDRSAFVSDAAPWMDSSSGADDLFLILYYDKYRDFIKALK